MRYLVTGGACFIGSNTEDELFRRGDSVVVLADLSFGTEDNLAEVRNKITFIKGGITDIEVVRKAMHEAEYVLHLAARTSVPRSVKDPIETNKINIDGTLNVLVAAKELKVKRVVFAASSSAYGETPTLPKVETTQPVVFGDGEQTRDFTYVENAVQANLLACEAPSVSGKVFNVGVGGRVSLNEVVRVLGKISGKTLETKYEPQVSFEEGLSRTYEWYRGTQTRAPAKTEK